MAEILLKDIKKIFIDKVILQKANLTVESGDKIGLIGANGAGKTTLFKIILGEISYDDGDIFAKKTLKIGYLEQQLNLLNSGKVYDTLLEIFSDLIAMEDRLKYLTEQISKEPHSKELLETYSKLLEDFNNKGGYSYPSMIRGTLIGLGFKEEDFDKDIGTLSGGQKARVALAKLLLEDSDILLLDEPTNHLDIEAINWLEKFLKDYKKALIVISHDRYFLNNVVNKIVLLEHGITTTYKGNYDYYVKKRKLDLEILKKQYEDQQKEIKRQEEIIKRFLNLGRDRFIKQGKSRKKLLDAMTKMPAPTNEKKTKISFTTEIESGKEVLQIEGLKKTFKDKLLFENLSLKVFKKDLIGLIGPNGIGKSTLFKIILGKMQKDQGKIEIGTNVKIAYFDQELKNLNKENTVIDEIWDAYPKLDHFQLRKYLAQFLFVGDDIFKSISELSGGEMGRLSLLKIMLSKANFLLLDEPTNHLDIDSKEILEDALNLYEGTVLAISHDRYFLNKVANKIFAMDKCGIDEYLGNYDYYLEKTQNTVENEDEYISKTQLQKKKKEDQKIRQEKKLLKGKKQKMEDEIKTLEENLSTIDAKLTNNSNYEDYKEILKLTEDRQKLENKLNSLYEEWILLDDKV